MMQILSEEGFEGFTQQGKDRREPLGDKINQTPYNNLLYLRARDRKNKFLKGGTAFLIDSHFALTAAHNIFDEDGILFPDIQVYPAATIELITWDSSKKTSAIKVSQTRYQKEFKQYYKQIKQRYHYDFALIQLEKGVDRKEYFKYLTSVSAQDLEEMSIEVEVSGYCSTKISHNAMGQTILNPQTHKDKIIKIKEGIIYHLADTYKGQSGSPMLVEINNSKYLIGLHFFFDENVFQNCGIYLDERRLQMLNGWMNEMKPRMEIYTLKEKKILHSTIEEITLANTIKNDGSNKELMPGTNERTKNKYFKNMRRTLDNNDEIVYEAKSSYLAKREIDGQHQQNLYDWMSDIPLPQNRQISLRVTFPKTTKTSWISLITETKRKMLAAYPQKMERIGLSSIFSYENSSDIFEFGRIYLFGNIMSDTEQRLFVKATQTIEISIDSQKQQLILFKEGIKVKQIYNLKQLSKDQAIYICIILTGKYDQIHVQIYEE